MMHASHFKRTAVLLLLLGSTELGRGLRAGMAGLPARVGVESQVRGRDRRRTRTCGGAAQRAGRKAPQYVPLELD